MSELEESDILEFINRLSIKKKDDGGILGGTRTFAGIIIFFRMAFKNYQKDFPRWINPFVRLDPPKHKEYRFDTWLKDAGIEIKGIYLSPNKSYRI